MKFSGSINIFGVSVDIAVNNIIASINPMVSLIVKYRWKWNSVSVGMCA